MSVSTQRGQGLLVLPHLNLQNVNAISSPLTHGFPSMTAFLGFMWALERALEKRGVSLAFDSVGVICHAYQEQVQNGYVKTFHLSRNPLDKNGSTAAIVEEGRMTLDVTLVFGTWGPEAREENLFFVDDDARGRTVALIEEVVATLRVAGGTVLPPGRMPGRRVRPYLLAWDEDDDLRDRQFRWLRRQWLPGTALVSRDDLLARRFEAMRAENPDANLLDAWLDLSRFNWRPVSTAEPAAEGAKVEWAHDRKGWIVPMPVGYSKLSELQPAGSVRHARDARTRFRFVESVYSVGEWIGPHRLDAIEDMLWYADTDADGGLYRCRNDYPQRLGTAVD
ncbi:CRISPR-associated protein Csy2 [Pigmentiphaga humi]|uniref:CRISPR-associated protein Csy2 n=1 Tax=Pigmentiphaga humi TaxID=2478468 RepID=A0A3P4AX55_9BURK|nr:type I-F CRISPR-associated protein Csy2 [Pigmentiphaga humi]VCU67960.1 CRISPR-associated protein Csy2 [Pigmentiphaga humi]